MKFQGKEQCWEHMKCGRDRDRAFGVSSVERCPAYPDYGRLCWPIAGTKCRDGARGLNARKIDNCESCAFFHAVVFSGMEES